MEKIRNLNSDSAVNKIEQLCIAQHSGTIFMVTEKKVMSQILLTEGEIIAIQYLSMRGMEALSLIFKTTCFPMFYFAKRDQSDIKPKVDNSLPSLNNILGMLNKAKQGVEYNGVGGEKISDKVEANNVDITKVMEIIITELTMHLGPVAPMVCEEYFEDAKSLSDIMGSLDKISSEIDNAAKANEFKRLVTEKIKRIG